MSDGVDAEKRATLRRFAAIGAASPLARVLEARPDRSDARDAIVGYLTATPGAHFSKVRDDLKMGTGETQYHLQQLLETGAVTGRRDGDYRRFFPANQFSPYEQIALGYLRRSTPRGMVIELLRDPTSSGRELAERLEVSRPTISAHAAELESADLLDRTDGYALRRPATLLVLLLRYAESFDAETVAFAAEAADLIRMDR